MFIRLCLSYLTYTIQQVICGVSQSCIERTSPPHIVPARRQSIIMDTSVYWSGCTENNGKVTCIAENTFDSARERWWYVAVSRCLNSTFQVAFVTLVGLPHLYSAVSVCKHINFNKFVRCLNNWSFELVFEKFCSISGCGQKGSTVWVPPQPIQNSGWVETGVRWNALSFIQVQPPPCPLPTQRHRPQPSSESPQPNTSFLS